MLDVVSETIKSTPQPFEPIVRKSFIVAPLMLSLPLVL